MKPKKNNPIAEQNEEQFENELRSAETEAAEETEEAAPAGGTPAEEAVAEAAADGETDGAEAAEHEAAEDGTAGDAPQADEKAQKKAQKKAERSAEKARRRTLQDRRRLRYGGVATAISLCVVAAIVLLNVIIGAVNDRFPLSLDLTSDQRLTLSEKSEEYAKSVTEEVQIVVFGDEKTFSSPSTSNSEYNDLCMQFYRALGQYRSLSGGKVTYSFVNLTEDPTSAAKYSSYEVENGNILFLSGNRSYKAKLDDLFTYNQQYYMYYNQLVLEESKVEQVLALGVSRVLSNDLSPVTLLTGHSEDAKVTAQLKKVLGDIGYVFEEKDITTAEEFPENSTVAVIAAPTKDYTDEELKTLREWVENDGNRGRKLVYLANPGATCQNLEEYLRDDFGIEVTHNLVVETSSSRYPAGNYPFYAYADLAQTDYTEAATKGLLLPMTLQLKVLWGSDTTASKYVLPVATFPESAELYPILEDEEAQKKVEQVKADEYPIVGMALATSVVYQNDDNRTSQVLVCGSSSFLLVDTAKNQETFLALFNGISGNQSLVTMPSKKLTAATAEFEDQKVANVLGLGVFTIGLPIVLLVIGLIVYRKRRYL